MPVVSNGRSNAVRQAAGTATGNLTGRGEAGSAGRANGGGRQPVASGNSGNNPAVATSGKPATNGATSGKKTSGKTSGKPEVETSGKSPVPLMAESFPLTDDSDIDVELGEEVGSVARGWRLEENSDGYWRWRWQMKDNDGKSVTYVNKSGKTGYKRGCKYVKVKELDKAKREAGL